MQSVFNTMKGTALGVAEYLTPVLKESKFRETGVLTPEEFVAAGDHLVHHCPTWQWAAGDEARLKTYLPADKQFLITRNVACHRRCKQMEYVGEETLVETADGDEEAWVETHHCGEDDEDQGTGDADGAVGELEDEVDEMTLDDAKVSRMKRQIANAPTKPSRRRRRSNGAHLIQLDKLRQQGDSKKTASNDDEDEEDDEGGDMEEFEESGQLEMVDPCEAIVVRAPPLAPVKSTADGGGAAGEADSVVRTRTYDLHITYDKYYQTPRLWVVGYNEVSVASGPETV